MDSKEILRKGADIMLFGVVLCIACVVGLGIYLYSFGHELIYDNSDITISNVCEGNVVGADDTLSRFVIYSSGYGRSDFERKLCIVDKKSGVVEFSEAIPGFKNKVSYSKEKDITNSFKDLPAPMATQFSTTSLPRFQFSPTGLIIVDKDKFEPFHIQVAAFSYDDLNLGEFKFSNWPKDTFAKLWPYYDVFFERKYQDAGEYVVTWKREGDSAPTGQFEATLEVGNAALNGLFLGDKILINVGGNVSAFALNGHKMTGGFCCAKSLKLLPGNQGWIVSDGDPLKLWQIKNLNFK